MAKVGKAAKLNPGKGGPRHRDANWQVAKMIDAKFEFDAPRFIDIAEDMCGSPPSDHDDPWFHQVRGERDDNRVPFSHKLTSSYGCDA